MSTTLQQYIGYDNKVTISNIAASSEQTAFPATNLSNVSTASKWKSDDASSVQYVTVSLGGVDVDYVGIAGHNFGTAGCAAEIQVQEVSGGSWVTAVSEFTPSTDRPVLKKWTAGVNLLVEPEGLTNTAYWVLDQTPVVTSLGNGEFTVEDNNIYAAEAIRQSYTITDITSYHSFSVLIKKDAVGRATRYPVLIVNYAGAVSESYYLFVDTSTGEKSGTGGINSSVTDNGDGYWKCEIIVKSSNQSNTVLYVNIFPAAGKYSGGNWNWDVSATGTITVKHPQLTVGATAVEYSAIKNSLYAVRLKLTPNTVTKPQAAILYTGAITLMERNTYVGHTPITYGRSVEAVNGFSESGAFLGRIIRGTTYAAKIAMKNITPAWYRSTFEPFVQAAIESPFFYAWRFVDYSTEVGFCSIKGGAPVPDNTGPIGMMSVSFNVEGVA